MRNIIIEKLNTELHDRDVFDCGIDVLNVYLNQRANQEQKKRLNVTHVAVHGDHSPKPIIGYYTLSNSSIALNSMQPEFKKQIPPTYTIPSVKIGRLAVDKTNQKNGIGTMLLQHAFKKIIEAATISGIRGVEVVAKNLDAIKYYEQFGFVRLQDSSNLLYLPVDTIINSQSGQV